MKFEHSTCKEDLRKKRLRDIKDIVTSKLVIYLAILVLVYLIPLILFCINPLVDLEWFSFWLGAMVWAVFYVESQKIVDLNQFVMYMLIGLFIVLLSEIMALIIKSSFFEFSYDIIPSFLYFLFSYTAVFVL